MSILITGSAGFIGFHAALKYLKINSKRKIIGIDNINNYYDTKLKRKRLKILKKYKNFKFYKINLVNYKGLEKIFRNNKIKLVINLAAQAGVRHSIKFPRDYVNSNLIGFFNIIDLSKKYKIDKFMFASTSSVYGDNNNYPLKEKYSVNHPIQFYAATKKANEVIAHSYSSLYDLQCIGLRFFTVYGPWGRPDMVLFKFVKNILNNKPIELFNFGNHYRDFTYIDDVVDIIFKLSKIKIKKEKQQNFEDSSNSKSRFKIFNVSSGKKIYLKKFLEIIEKNLDKKAIVKFLPLQRGDVVQTMSSKKKIKEFINLKPSISVQTGIKKFIFWFKQYHNLK